MTIRPANEQDKATLMALWRECFAEEEAFLQAFFSLRYPMSKALVAETGGQTVSALYLFPISVLHNGQMRKAYYLVGASTKESNRGKGYMSALLTEARKQISTPIFLYPAKRAFYEARGYSNGAEGVEITLQPTDGKSCPPSDNWRAAMVCRHKAIATRGYGILRDEIGWQLALVGRKLITFGNAAYALIEGKTCVEALAENEEAAFECLSVLQGLGVKSLRTFSGSVFCRICPKENQKNHPLGMVYGDKAFQTLPISEEY